MKTVTVQVVGRLADRGFSSEFIAKKLGVSVEQVLALRAKVETFQEARHSIRCLCCFSTDLHFPKGKRSHRNFACRECGWTTADPKRAELLKAALPILATIDAEVK